jgi:tRNA pseudouridine55 synthase
MNGRCAATAAVAVSPTHRRPGSRRHTLRGPAPQLFLDIALRFQRRARIRYRPILAPVNAIILVDKPAGISSAEVVRRIKARLKPARVGHLGTLDPFATGVLPILVGEATKLAPFLEATGKEYEGVIKLGAETDTLDRDGEVVRTAEVPALDAARLDAVAARFTGEIEQVPPIYSAIKRAGTPLYKLARKGKPVEPPEARKVVIRRLELTPAPPDSIRFTALCSPGTYARSLARDIALELGSAGHLIELRRLRNGAFALDDAASLERVLDALDGNAENELHQIGLRDALPDLPEVELDAGAEARLRNGDARALDGRVPDGAVLFKVISSAGGLVAVARAESRATATIERIFNP